MRFISGHVSVITLYIVEKTKDPGLGAASALMGDYAVRVFASLRALRHLAKVPGNRIPDVVIADLDDLATHADEALAQLVDILPDSPIILVHTMPSYGDDLRLNTGDAGRVFSYRKPFDTMDLSAFVALVARAQGKRPGIMRIRDFILDFERLQCFVFPNEVPINLPLKEAQILKFLMERPCECLSREDLQHSLWPGVKVSSRTIDSHVSRLRKRLQTSPIQIRSKYGGGYILQVIG